MEPPISKEDSYAERRQLFKKIWNPAKNFEEKQRKVIKTVRLESSYRCTDAIKKYKFKALKSICTKLLHATTTRQDAAGVSNIIKKGSRKVRKRLRPSVRLKKYSNTSSFDNDENFGNLSLTTTKNAVDKSLPLNEIEKNCQAPVLLSELLEKHKNINSKPKSYNTDTKTRKIKSTIPKAKKKRRFRKKLHKVHRDLNIPCRDNNSGNKPSKNKCFRCHSHKS